MTDKYVLTPCVIHPDCTLRADFADVGDGGYDPSTDAKPTSQFLQDYAEAHFGDVFCVGIQHLNGALNIVETS